MTESKHMRNKLSLKLTSLLCLVILNSSVLFFCTLWCVWEKWALLWKVDVSNRIWPHLLLVNSNGQPESGWCSVHNTSSDWISLALKHSRRAVHRVFRRDFGAYQHQSWREKRNGDDENFVRLMEKAAGVATKPRKLYFWATLSKLCTLG